MSERNVWKEMHDEEIAFLRMVYADIEVLRENGNPYHVGGRLSPEMVDRIASRLGYGAIGALGSTGSGEVMPS